MTLSAGSRGRMSRSRRRTGRCRPGRSRGRGGEPNRRAPARGRGLAASDPLRSSPAVEAAPARIAASHRTFRDPGSHARPRGRGTACGRRHRSRSPAGGRWRPGRSRPLPRRAGWRAPRIRSLTSASADQRAVFLGVLEAAPAADPADPGPGAVNPSKSRQREALTGSDATERRCAAPDSTTVTTEAASAHTAVAPEPGAWRDRSGKSPRRRSDSARRGSEGRQTSVFCSTRIAALLPLSR